MNFKPFVERDDLLLEFVEKQDHEAVLLALQRFPDSPELLLQGLKVLLLLADLSKCFLNSLHEPLQLHRSTAL